MLLLFTSSLYYYCYAYYSYIYIIYILYILYIYIISLGIMVKLLLYTLIYLWNKLNKQEQFYIYSFYVSMLIYHFFHLHLWISVIIWYHAAIIKLVLTPFILWLLISRFCFCITGPTAKIRQNQMDRDR